MNRAAEFLQQCGTFYLATDDGGQPRVRPFGAVTEYEGKTYICTNNTKNVFKQMVKNPKVEISATKGSDWIRITGEAVPDSRTEVKEKMLEAMPSLRNMYRADDGIFEVLYLKDAKATFYSFSGKPETINI